MGLDEFIVILVIAVLVIGPERLPQYVKTVTEFVRGAKKFMNETKANLDKELGPEFADVDWQKLDPRQYDPRKIVRDALIEDTILDPNLDAKRAAAAGVAAGGAAIVGASAESEKPVQLGFDTYKPMAPGTKAPYDDEAT